MMKLLDTLHRWTGGLIGLLLALMGLSGTILLYEHLWIGVPGAGDPLRGDLATVAATTERLMATPGAQGIIYADERFGLHQLRFNEGAGAYASQSGEIVARWARDRKGVVEGQRRTVLLDIGGDRINNN